MCRLQMILRALKLVFSWKLCAADLFNMFKFICNCYILWQWLLFTLWFELLGSWYVSGAHPSHGRTRDYISWPTLLSLGIHHLHFLLAVSHKSVSLYHVSLLILQFFSIICLLHAQQTYENPWFIFPPKNEWRILFAMMIILIPRCLLNTNFYCAHILEGIH